MKGKHNSSTVKLGLLQMQASANPRDNFRRTLAAVEAAAKKGAKIICTQELFRSYYFCQNEDHANFKLAESIPGPSTDAFQKIAKKHGVVIIASLFEKGRRVCIIIRLPLLMPMALCWVFIERCTFRMTRFFTKNFILLPEILVSKRGPQSLDASGS